MTWNVQLENENRKVISSLDELFDCPLLHNSEVLEKSHLLRYVDPYGDTVFNNLQIDDLLADLEMLLEYEPENGLIKEIIKLANECKSRVHTYLVFYGD